jgi:hypothetical protein
VDLRSVPTARLRLDAVVPAGRHTSPERTAAGIACAGRHRADDGLGHWSARLREDVGDLPAEVTAHP